MANFYKITIFIKKKNVYFSYEIFKKIENSWNLPTCSQGKSKVCAEKCGIGFDAFGDQWR